MSMYSISDIRKDSIIQIDGDPYRVVEYAHSKKARGGAVARLKLRNLRTGSTVSKTMQGSDKVESANVLGKEAQYLYGDGDNLVFMDLDTYEQTSARASLIGELAKFLREGSIVTVLLFDKSIIGVELPAKITAKVTKTEPGVRGDTVSNTLKPATIEGGTKVQVPLFINTGDTIKVDTRSGEYLGRV